MSAFERCAHAILLVLYYSTRRCGRFAAQSFNFLRMTAVITTACFIWSSVIAPGLYATVENLRESTTAAAAAAVLNDVAIPYTAGHITDARLTGSDTVVINIQDLHCHAEVQRNIGRILEHLDRRYGLKKVYVEGACGNVDTSWINLLDTKEERDEMVQTLLDGGRLTGTEYYAITAKRYDLLAGIENEGLYHQNIKRLGEIMGKQPALAAALHGREQQIASLKREFFSKRNLRLEQLISKNENAAISPDKYYQTLLKLLEKGGGNVNDYPVMQDILTLHELQRSLHYKKISAEMQQFIASLKEKLPYRSYAALMEKARDPNHLDELYSALARLANAYPVPTAAYPSLATFFSYVEKSQRINAVRLLAEEQLLIRTLHRTLSATEGEREIAFLGDLFTLLQQYLNNSISADDYAILRRNMHELQILWAKYFNRDDMQDLQKYYALFDAFYEANLQRNAVFLQNILPVPTPTTVTGAMSTPALNSDQVPEALKSAKNIIVIVTGGFHTNGLTSLLNQRNISHLVITPNATATSTLSGKVYRRLAQQQAGISYATIAMELFSEILASQSWNEQKVSLYRANVETKLQIVIDLYQQKGYSPEQIADIISTTVLPGNLQNGYRHTGSFSYDPSNHVYVFTNDIELDGASKSIIIHFATTDTQEIVAQNPTRTAHQNFVLKILAAADHLSMLQDHERRDLLNNLIALKDTDGFDPIFMYDELLKRKQPEPVISFFMEMLQAHDKMYTKEIIAQINQRIDSARDAQDTESYHAAVSDLLCAVSRGSYSDIMSRFIKIVQDNLFDPRQAFTMLSSNKATLEQKELFLFITYNVPHPENNSRNIDFIKHLISRPIANDDDFITLLLLYKAAMEIENEHDALFPINRMKLFITLMEYMVEPTGFERSDALFNPDQILHQMLEQGATIKQLKTFADLLEISGTSLSISDITQLLKHVQIADTEKDYLAGRTPQEQIALIRFLTVKHMDDTLALGIVANGIRHYWMNYHALVTAWEAIAWKAVQSTAQLVLCQRARFKNFLVKQHSNQPLPMEHAELLKSIIRAVHNEHQIKLLKDRHEGRLKKKLSFDDTAMVSPQQLLSSLLGISGVYIVITQAHTITHVIRNIFGPLILSHGFINTAMFIGILSVALLYTAYTAKRLLFPPDIIDPAAASLELYEKYNAANSNSTENPSNSNKRREFRDLPYSVIPVLQNEPIVAQVEQFYSAYVNNRDFLRIGSPDDLEKLQTLQVQIEERLSNPDTLHSYLEDYFIQTYDLAKYPEITVELVIERILQKPDSAASAFAAMTYLCDATCSAFNRQRYAEYLLNSEFPSIRAIGFLTLGTFSHVKNRIARQHAVKLISQHVKNSDYSSPQIYAYVCSASWKLRHAPGGFTLFYTVITTGEQSTRDEIKAQAKHYHMKYLIDSSNHRAQIRKNVIKTLRYLAMGFMIYCLLAMVFGPVIASGITAAAVPGIITGAQEGDNNPDAPQSFPTYSIDPLEARIEGICHKYAENLFSATQTATQDLRVIEDFLDRNIEFNRTLEEFTREVTRNEGLRCTKKMTDLLTIIANKIQYVTLVDKTIVSQVAMWRNNADTYHFNQEIKQLLESIFASSTASEQIVYDRDRLEMLLESRAYPAMEQALYSLLDSGNSEQKQYAIYNLVNHASRPGHSDVFNQIIRRADGFDYLAAKKAYDAFTYAQKYRDKSEHKAPELLMHMALHGTNPEARLYAIKMIAGDSQNETDYFFKQLPEQKTLEFLTELEAITRQKETPEDAIIHQFAKLQLNYLQWHSDDGTMRKALDFILQQISNHHKPLQAITVLAAITFIAGFAGLFSPDAVVPMTVSAGFIGGFIGGFPDRNPGKSFTAAGISFTECLDQLKTHLRTKELFSLTSVFLLMNIISDHDKSLYFEARKHLFDDQMNALPELLDSGNYEAILAASDFIEFLTVQLMLNEDELGLKSDLLEIDHALFEQKNMHSVSLLLDALNDYLPEIFMVAEECLGTLKTVATRIASAVTLTGLSGQRRRSGNNTAPVHVLQKKVLHINDTISQKKTYSPTMRRRILEFRDKEIDALITVLWHGTADQRHDAMQCLGNHLPYLESGGRELLYKKLMAFAQDERCDLSLAIALYDIIDFYTYQTPVLLAFLHNPHRNVRVFALDEFASLDPLSAAVRNKYLKKQTIDTIISYYDNRIVSRRDNEDLLITEEQVFTDLIANRKSFDTILRQHGTLVLLGIYQRRIEFLQSLLQEKPHAGTNDNRNTKIADNKIYAIHQINLMRQEIAVQSVSLPEMEVLQPAINRASRQAVTTTLDMLASSDGYTTSIALKLLLTEPDVVCLNSSRQQAIDLIALHPDRFVQNTHTAILAYCTLRALIIEPQESAAKGSSFLLDINACRSSAFDSSGELASPDDYLASLMQASATAPDEERLVFLSQLPAALALIQQVLDNCAPDELAKINTITSVRDQYYRTLLVAVNDLVAPNNTDDRTSTAISIDDVRHLLLLIARIPDKQDNRSSDNHNFVTEIQRQAHNAIQILGIPIKKSSEVSHGESHNAHEFANTVKSILIALGAAIAYTAFYFGINGTAGIILPHAFTLGVYTGFLGIALFPDKLPQAVRRLAIKHLKAGLQSADVERRAKMFGIIETLRHTDNTDIGKKLFYSQVAALPEMLESDNFNAITQATQFINLLESNTDLQKYMPDFDANTLYSTAYREQLSSLHAQLIPSLFKILEHKDYQHNIYAVTEIAKHAHHADDEAVKNDAFDHLHAQATSCTVTVAEVLATVFKHYAPNRLFSLLAAMMDNYDPDVCAFAVREARKISIGNRKYRTKNLTFSDCAAIHLEYDLEQETRRTIAPLTTARDAENYVFWSHIEPRTGALIETYGAAVVLAIYAERLDFIQDVLRSKQRAFRRVNFSSDETSENILFALAQTNRMKKAVDEHSRKYPAMNILAPAINECRQLSLSILFDLLESENPSKVKSALVLLKNDHELLTAPEDRKRAIATMLTYAEMYDDGVSDLTLAAHDALRAIGDTTAVREFHDALLRNSNSPTHALPTVYSDDPTSREKIVKVYETIRQIDHIDDITDAISTAAPEYREIRKSLIDEAHQVLSIHPVVTTEGKIDVLDLSHLAVTWTDPANLLWGMYWWNRALMAQKYNAIKHLCDSAPSLIGNNIVFTSSSYDPALIDYAEMFAVNFRSSVVMPMGPELDKKSYDELPVKARLGNSLATVYAKKLDAGNGTVVFMYEAARGGEYSPDGFALAVQELLINHPRLARKYGLRTGENSYLPAVLVTDSASVHPAALMQDTFSHDFSSTVFIYNTLRRGSTAPVSDATKQQFDIVLTPETELIALLHQAHLAYTKKNHDEQLITDMSLSVSLPFEQRNEMSNYPSKYTIVMRDIPRNARTEDLDSAIAQAHFVHLNNPQGIVFDYQMRDGEQFNEVERWLQERVQRGSDGVRLDLSECSRLPAIEHIQHLRRVLWQENQQTAFWIIEPDAGTAHYPSELYTDFDIGRAVRREVSEAHALPQSEGTVWYELFLDQRPLDESPQPVYSVLQSLRTLIRNGQISAFGFDANLFKKAETLMAAEKDSFPDLIDDLLQELITFKSNTLGYRYERGFNAAEKKALDRDLLKSHESTLQMLINCDYATLAAILKSDPDHQEITATLRMQPAVFKDLEALVTGTADTEKAALELSEAHGYLQKLHDRSVVAIYAPESFSHPANEQLLVWAIGKTKELNMDAFPPDPQARKKWFRLYNQSMSPALRQIINNPQYARISYEEIQNLIIEWQAVHATSPADAPAIAALLELLEFADDSEYAFTTFGETLNDALIRAAKAIETAA